MKRKFTIDVDNFTKLLNVYMAVMEFTQEDFGVLNLTNRQAIASLRKLEIEDISDVMLYRLYYYFDVIVGEEKSDIETRLLKMISNELSKRIEENFGDRELGTPRGVSRKRK